MKLTSSARSGDHPTALGGTCSARFNPLRELFAAKLESGEDLGASLAVNIDGEMVVDLWGGWADEARTMPWTENTITCVFSTTKTMTSLAALTLVDRGELDLDPNVPRFKTFTGPTMPADMKWSWTEGWRRADIGAANGHGNARSVARIQSAVACGGAVDGVRLLSPKTIDRILEVQSHTVDHVMGIQIKMGVGYGSAKSP